MNILLLGSGGREHALAWKLRQSPLVSDIFCAPGNAGTALEAVNVDIGAVNVEGLVSFAKREKIDLAWAWALDSPFQWMKQIASHFGGTRNGMAMSWPSRIRDRGGGDVALGRRRPRALHVALGGAPPRRESHDVHAVRHRQIGRAHV